MKRSQFTQVAREVLGEAAASSYLSDLTLPGVGYRTAREALDQGERPQAVWDALVDELDLGEPARWHHRREPED